MNTPIPKKYSTIVVISLIVLSLSIVGIYALKMYRGEDSQSEVAKKLEQLAKLKTNPEITSEDSARSLSELQTNSSITKEEAEARLNNLR